MQATNLSYQTLADYVQLAGLVASYCTNVYLFAPEHHIRLYCITFDWNSLPVVGVWSKDVLLLASSQANVTIIGVIWRVA